MWANDMTVRNDFQPEGLSTTHIETENFGTRTRKQKQSVPTFQGLCWWDTMYTKENAQVITLKFRSYPARLIISVLKHQPFST